MRKLVYASKKDDLIAQRDEYDRQLNEKQSKAKSQEEKWRMALSTQADYIKNQIVAKLGVTEGEDVIVRVDDYVSAKGGHWRVYIEGNDRTKFSEDTALAWHVSIDVDSEGNIKKETGSWSGLQAVTPKQLSNLKRTVQFLEVIQKIDWEPIVKAPIAKYSDYVDDQAYKEAYEAKRNRPNFEAQIAAEEINDYVGTDKWIKLHSSPSSYVKDSRQGFWAQIVKQTPGSYTVRMVNSYAGPYWFSDPERLPEYRVNKSKFFDCLVKPIQVKGEVQE